MRTTISLSPETKEKLSKLGKHGESYEDIIKRLINTNINHEDLQEIIINLQWAADTAESEYLDLDRQTECIKLINKLKKLVKNHD